jgi:hypothetical protein
MRTGARSPATSQLKYTWAPVTFQMSLGLVSMEGQFWKLGSPRAGWQRGLVLVRAQFLASKWLPSFYVLTRKRVALGCCNWLLYNLRWTLLAAAQVQMWDTQQGRPPNKETQCFTSTMLLFGLFRDKSRPVILGPGCTLKNHAGLLWKMPMPVSHLYSTASVPMSPLCSWARR